MREEEGSGGVGGAQRDKREERGTFLVAQGLRHCRAHGFHPWYYNKKKKRERGRKSELPSGQWGN